MEKNTGTSKRRDKGLPPFARTWKQFYGLVVGWLVASILLMYLFSRYFG